MTGWMLAAALAATAVQAEPAATPELPPLRVLDASEVPTVLAVPPVDPALRTAARRVVDLSMPAEEMATTMRQLIGDAFDQQMAAMENDDSFKTTLGANPQLQRRFDRFVADMRQLTQTVMDESTPALLDALTDYYAGRYSVAELAEIEAFLQTPTGRRYAREGFVMLQDPLMTGWQARIGATLEERGEAILNSFVADMTRLATKAAP